MAELTTNFEYDTLIRYRVFRGHFLPHLPLPGDFQISLVDGVMYLVGVWGQWFIRR